MAKPIPRVRNAMKQSKSSAFKWVFCILLFVLVAGALVLQNWPAFGGTISSERLQKAEASTHYEDGRFTNILPHPSLELGDVWDYLVEQSYGDQSRIPPFPTPIAPIPLALFEAQPTRGLRAIWLGHSSVYLELSGLRLMIDPVFSEYA